MPRGGDIRIATCIERLDKVSSEAATGARSGTYARIDVEDKGAGIPPELLPRIFEPFVSSKKSGTGTGLGLSIVYGIVRKHRGHITAHSQPNQGTTMSVFFPVRRSRKKASAVVAPRETAHRGGHETILVADDETIITKSTARFLERYGYKTFTAYDGKEALTVYKRHAEEIDLVLLDMEMPEMTGPECLVKLRELRPDLNVITFSGHIIKDPDWDPSEAGTHTAIEKPFDSTKLLDTVRQILDG